MQDRPKQIDIGQASDEDLMLLYQADHEEAFHILYQRYAGRVYGFLRQKLQNAETAADVCQIIFTKLHRSRHRYHSTLPFAPWLFAITRNALTDTLRSQQVQNRTLLYDPDWESVVQPEDLAPSKEADVIPLNRLPPAQRDAVELRYLENLSFDDIAQRLDTSPANARQLVSRGLKKLRAFFPSQEKKA